MSTINVDMHCHSTFSDGLLPPVELVERGHRNGVELMALTDHDEIAGLVGARASAEALGVRFIDGAEISVSWLEQSVHIVGLGFDPANPALVAGLQRIRDGRHVRAQGISDDLARIGVRGALEGAMRYAGNPALISRSHFARYLVEIGCARDISNVFEHYLVRGKPGFVEHEWASLDEAVAWIHSAGGLAVIAHPGRTRLSKAELFLLFDRFKDLGGDAIEVVSGAQIGDDALEYARVARRYGFLASRASDFHGPTESPVDIGRCEILPPDLLPVWDRLV